MCFDLTNRSTFDDVRGWVDSVRAHALPGCVFLVIGTKKDLCVGDGSARAVTSEEGIALAATLNSAYIEVSAKTNDNVAEAMQIMLEHTLAGDIAYQLDENTVHLSPNPFSHYGRMGSPCCGAS